MVKAFEDGVLALEDGDISAPIKTNYGFHIIKRIGTRTRSQEPLEKMEDNLRKTIEREKQGEKALEFVDGMFAERNLVIDEKAVEVVVDKFKAIEGSEEPPEIKFSDEEKNMTVATWDGGVWTLTQLDSAINLMPAYQRQPLASSLDVENFIKGNLQGEFLVGKADKMGIENTKKYKEMFDAEVAEMIVGTFQNQSIYGKVEVSDADVQAYYEATPDSFMAPKTIVAVEVQVAEEAEAKSIVDKVKAGKDLAKFVEEKSLRTYTKKAGGIIEITERRFPNLFAATASAKAGDIVGPAKDRTNRWSVLKVTDVKEPQVMPLDQVSGRIQSTLRRDLRDKAMEDFITSAKTEFGLKIYDKTIAASIDSSLYKTPDEVEKVAE
jgi:parvulin-like peptidyl-prolyl isomerase